MSGLTWRIMKKWHYKTRIAWVYLLLPTFARTLRSSLFITRRLIFVSISLGTDAVYHTPGAVAEFPGRIARPMPDNLDRVSRTVTDFPCRIARGMTDGSSGVFDFGACA